MSVWKLTDEQTRQWFRHAHLALSHALRQLTPEQLDEPGLGVWDVRALLGHLSRSYLTIEGQLGGDADAELLPSAAAYYAVIASHTRDAEATAERGRLAGQALGEEPVEQLLAIGKRVVALVKETPDDAVVQTPFGSLRLIEYLQTRAFELSVHTLDLVRALDLTGDEDQRLASTFADHFAVELAAQRGRSDDLLLALTGRQGLPAGFGAL